MTAVLLESLQRRLIHRMLYGRNVDRGARARARIGLVAVAFAVAYAVIAFRIVVLVTFGDRHAIEHTASHDALATARPDIIDRNGEILATDIKAPSLYGEPRRIIDKDEAIELLTAALPDLDTIETRDRLSGRKGFVWLKREITPQERENIHKLGIPGIGFIRENKRVYPSGAEVAHLIGLVNIDNEGIAGIEKWLDKNTDCWICTRLALQLTMSSNPCSCPLIYACNMRYEMNFSPQGKNLMPRRHPGW